MIAQLIEVLDAAVSLPVVHHWGLAERMDNGPHVHVDADQYTPIATDQYHTWSYWRLTNGPVTNVAQEFDACGGGVRHELALRLVVMLDNDCDAVQVMADASRAAQDAAKGIRAVTGAAIVRIGRRVVYTDGVQQQEGIASMPLHRRLVALDMALEMLGVRDCLSGCDPVDVACAIIERTSTDKIRDCLGDRVYDLCDCSPSSPGDCPVDLDIYVEGNLVAQLSGLDPCVDNEIFINWT